LLSCKGGVKVLRTSVTKCFEFEASHHLPNYDGACARPHGHSYKLHVTVSGDLKDTGMIADFKVLKEVVQTHILSKVDHEDLNVLYQNPTAENMVQDFFYTLRYEFRKLGLKVINVKLWETSSSYAECSIEGE
jgi:6-pyruvoyltetrahydropterin/6-carboxytetrahydropterin synthase